MNQVSPTTAPHPLDDPTVPVDYDSDVALWVERQVYLLRTGNFSQLDLDNLIEELEAINNRDRREISSRLVVLIVHLLKCQSQPERKSGSWRSSIREQRSEIAALLEESPSNCRLIPDKVRKAYKPAVMRAMDETGLAASAFPNALPWSPEQILDPEFFP